MNGLQVIGGLVAISCVAWGLGTAIMDMCDRSRRRNAPPKLSPGMQVKGFYPTLDRLHPSVSNFPPHTGDFKFSNN